jgi:hypothetical protein
MSSSIIVNHNFHSHAGRDTDERWQYWQQEVLAVIRTDFRHVLAGIEWDDIDWAAWRPLYEQGCSPKEAVHNAFGQVA